MDLIFFELTIILIISSIIAVVFRLIKQPSILAYILAGILLGPVGLLAIENKDVVKSMAEIGIALLLFMLGLELRLSDLRSIGKVALLVGSGQVIFTSAIGFLIGLLLGFQPLPALYISIALTFSSTIIIVKLLSDKRDLNSLYGKISVGVLLLQDLFAIIALIILSGFTQDGAAISPVGILFVIAKGVLLFAVVLLLSKTVLPAIVNKIARSQEILFLFSLAWAFGVCALVASPYVGFSIEIGGFLAGLALANSPESIQIASRAKSLRDFFIIIFFVTLGMGMTFAGIDKVVFPAIALSLFVLVGNPLIVMAIMGIMGYKKRTSFLTGLTVAQISEFSLIVIFLGNKLNHVSNQVVSLITLVGVITFAASTYMIMNSDYLFRLLSPYLSIFEKKQTKKETRRDLGELNDHIVLAGVNRAGSAILEGILESKDEKVIAIDFNPDVIKNLNNREILAVFGDISDSEILDHTQIEKAKVVISTVSDLDDNLHLITLIKRRKSRAKIIALARDKHDAFTLYNAGADYVVIPHLTSGRFISRILKDNANNLDVHKEKDFKFFELNKSS